MSKSADAFRTISEVAEWLDTPAHVLRFWESKFTQVKPVKRAGGRRYYRPADMRLLGGIKKLLHEDGMTIKGAQKILREQGIKHVASLCALSVGEEDDFEDVTLEEVIVSDPVDTVVPFTKPADPDEALVPDHVEEVVADVFEPEDTVHEPDEPVVEDADSAALETMEQPAVEITTDATETVDEEPAPIADEDAPAVEEGAMALPGFLQQSMEDRLDEPETPDEPAVEEPVESAALRAPDHKPHLTLTHLAKIERLPPEIAAQIAPLAERLRAVAS